MENIERVTTMCVRGRTVYRMRIGGCCSWFDPRRAGRGMWMTRSGTGGRTGLSKERSTFDAVRSEQQAFEAAKAFGEFQRMLADLPAPRLHESIPDFHHTAKRFADF